VHSYFQQNKLECFNLWLDCDKSWDRTKLKVQRIQEQSNESKKGWHSVQGKTIKAQFSAEKAEQIIQSRTNAGMYYDCEDFPGDVDDTCHCFRKTSCLFWSLKKCLKQHVCKLQMEKISNKERWYYMKASQKFTQKDTCTDRMKLDATANIEHDLLQSLINPEHGLLKPGCMPQVHSATTGGCKQLLDAISKALKVDLHPKRNKRCLF